MTAGPDVTTAGGEPVDSAPAAPDQRPSAPRLRRKAALAAGSVVVAAAVVGALAFGQSQRSGPDHRPAATATSVPSVTSTVVPADAPLKRVAAEAQLILNRRAEAVLDGDQKAFLHDVLPGDSKALAHQKALYRSLRRLDLGTFVTKVVPDRHLELAAVTSRWGPHAWVLTARTSYDFGSHAQGENWYAEPFTFVPRDGRWWIASDQLGLSQVHDGGDLVPWRLGETWVARGKRCIIIANAADRSRLAVLAKRVDAAVASVAKTWPEDQYQAMDQRKVVVMASGSPKVLRELNHGDGPQPVAVTRSTSPGEGAVPSSIHIVLDARKDGSRDLRTLTHEVTHALLFEREYEGTPTWLAEGVAEYTAFRDLSLRELLSTRGTDSRTYDELMARRYHLTFPSSKTFYSGTSTAVGYHYTSALLLCAYVEHEFGVKKLIRLHDKLGTILSSKDSSRLQAKYIRSELGVTQTALLNDASAWVQATVDGNFR